MEEAKMEKFKELVIKLANTVSNKPLSETQNSIIRDRFDRFFSVHHTPDHPPYAWMIERALRELNEEGGSSEESISNLIRKEYDDLPWSHFTLLNHHLQELCKCGSIVLTRGQHYLLVGADSTFNSSKKCRRKNKRRKRDWDWQIKRRKRRKKDIGKKSLLQNKDQVHEKQNCKTGGLKQQNIEAEARKGTPQLCIVGEDGEQTEGYQIEISSPERPPGFDSGTWEESSHLPLCCTENPSPGTYPARRPPKVMVSAAEGLSGHQEQIHVFNVYDQVNHEEDQMVLSKHGTIETSTDKTLQDLQPMTRTNGIDLQRINNEEAPAMPIQKGTIEHCSQKKPPESEITKSTAAISESGPVNSAGGERVSRIVFKYRKQPPITHAAKEKDIFWEVQQRREELQQEHVLSNTNKQQKMKSGAANRSEHQGFPIPPVKPSCKGKKYPQEIIEVPDSTPLASSLLQHELEEHQISDANELQEVKSGTASRSKHQALLIPAARPSCEEHHESEALNGVPEEPAISTKLPICPKQLNGGDAREFSLLPKPFEPETMDTEESLATYCMQRKRNRRCKQLSNVKRPQLEHQLSVESSRATEKQAKLHSHEKRNAGQLRVILALPVALKQADSQELSKLAKLQMPPEVEPQTQTSKHQAKEQVSQEKPSYRVLRPRPLKPEQSKALATADFSPSRHEHDMQEQPKYNLRRRPLKAKPYGGILNDKVVSFPKPHLRQQSQNPKHRHCGQPSKCKLGSSKILNKKKFSRTRLHRPENHGHGKL